MLKLLRNLPAIHELQQEKQFHEILQIQDFSKERLTEWVQAEVSKLRSDIIEGTFKDHTNFNQLIFERIDKRIKQLNKPTLQRVINATGTVLHTNLGRAALSKEAISRVAEVASHYSNLEYNLSEQKRGSRHDIIESLVKETTGAEAAMVVNNNAAAVFLVLKALASDKEVIVSRGELVEIGGSFRISSIMAESGASLVEVGTTNKTHFYDYEEAITEETMMIMKVHTSNFKTIGFTSEVASKELVSLANQRNLIIYEDLGSGDLFQFRNYGIGDEPTVKESLAYGLDLVTFSGDKLLGGPQAGIIAGKKKWIDRLKKHQLARVLRVDKMTLAALEATLIHYVKGSPEKNIPTIKSICLNADEIRAKAEAFRTMLPDNWRAELSKDVSMVGGGTMPAVELPTWLLLLSKEGAKTQSLYHALHKGSPAIVTRIKDEQLALDFRTIEEEDYGDILNRIWELE
ncbi:L-seryl-tRNA(Sec) selenium transferase [Bacillus solitudinis]|uniref:L-seryl-tRNA(Sec) selenium transferase n=1 Tax=Bacillus solitudinis TaxID=2014074 RepID=UPI000C2345BF|nr:L-seryl-tRNA(Sec) selenium transferase [Bacillus solitudinis]